jgi:phage tail sheath protein FI
MPVALSYPGVYVEEIPSGVRTITGVATSITAFLGRAISGPINTPVTIYSVADFERQFGGLGIDYPMSYAVANFYQNGGGQAIIVRLFKAPASGTGVGQVTADSLTLNAASPGRWSSGLSAAVDNNNITDAIAGRYGLKAVDLFNLTVTLTTNGQIAGQERFINLSVKQDKDVPVAAGRAQRIDRVLLQSSQLVRVPLNADGTPNLPTKTPQPPAPPPAAAASGGTAAAGGTAAGGSGGTTGGSPAAAGAGGSTGAAAGGGGSGGGAASPPANSGSDDGQPLGDGDFEGKQADKSGLFALDTADLFNLLCIPPDTRGGDTSAAVYQAAMAYCQTRRAMLIVDPPSAWSANPVTAADTAKNGLDGLGLNGPSARNAALYFPRVIAPDQLTSQLDTFVPCGLVAGAMAATDAQRGVWKAPAGLDASLSGISGLAVKLTNDENGTLNQLGINCLRNFPVYGNIVWGARTLRGADQMADEYKYIPVRRLALYIEESLFRGTQWVVFEPNDEPLWAQIRLNVGAFMHNLFVKGAFQGQTPAAAYFVKCDKDTTTQNDIDLGVVNILVGFAPLKPAEFVVLQIQQIAGDILT